MCKVYNTIGSLTAIKSHLRHYNITEFNSLKEVMSFQKNYDDSRQQILSHHELIIAQEKNRLSAAIPQLNNTINTKKIEVEEELKLEIQHLKQKLEELSLGQKNIIQKLTSYFKQRSLQNRIRSNESGVDIKVFQSIQYLADTLAEKNNRYQYITSRFPEAINQSCAIPLKELERKKTEEERELARKKIEESEKQYVQLVHDLPAAVYTCDLNGRILLYNKAAIELWGREPEVGEEFWCGSLKLYDTDNNLIPREESPMMMVIKKGIKLEGREMIIERPDETRRHVMLHPSPNFNAAGQVIGATNTMIDITDCKKAMLESLMLVDRLELKNKELSQFGYMLSHNLRGPVARILGLASIFDVEPNDNNFIVEKIKEATVELDDVVKDINSVVSVRNSENDKLELVLFEHIFDLVKEILAREIAHCNPLITTDFTAARSVRTVRNYLYSMLFNLLSNALKFRIPDSQLRVHVRTFIDGDSICLSVKDNGMGVDLERNRSKIFGLYRKFHGLPGKGAGLHLVKAQAESLGGRVAVDSKVDEGSEFRIYLPIKK